MGMITKPAVRPRSAAPFENLQRAHRANLLTVSVGNVDRLNRPGSPVWDPRENAAPLLALLSLSMIGIFIFNLAAGTSMMVLSMLAYISVIRPWILGRVQRRALDLAMESVHNWDSLWNKGCLVISLNDADNTSCASPADSWRGLVGRKFSQPVAISTELYEAFRKGEKEGADLTPVLISAN